jgi:hypothetical protein
LLRGTIGIRGEFVGGGAVAVATTAVGGGAAGKWKNILAQLWVREKNRFDLYILAF